MSVGEGEESLARSRKGKKGGKGGCSNACALRACARWAYGNSVSAQPGGVRVTARDLPDAATRPTSMHCCRADSGKMAVCLCALPWSRTVVGGWSHLMESVAGGLSKEPLRYSRTCRYALQNSGKTTSHPMEGVADGLSKEPLLC